MGTSRFRPRISRLTIFFTWISIATATPASALAQDGTASSGEELDYASMAVQNRLYDATHELTLFGGLLPLDAFTKGATLGGSYTLHFTPVVGWEVVQYLHSFPLHTSLRDELAVFDLAPTPFEIVENLITSTFLFKPVYWKGAFLNRSILHGELILTAGGGYGWFTRSGRACVSLGAGLRLYTNRLLSFRIDVRHLSFFNDSVFQDLDLHHELWTSLGVSLSF
jgi:outer membrane beta-barrel protein